MRIAGTEYTLQEKAFDIFISGCTRQCPGCHNSELWSFDIGEEITVNYLKELRQKIENNKELIKIIRIMGGDLLEQDDTEARVFIKFLKHCYPEFYFVLYTGAELEEIPYWCFDIFDGIKYGRFIQELKIDNPLFGSSNQFYIQKSIYGEWPV